MDQGFHHFSELFAQLGLPASEAEIRNFIATHSPLADDVPLTVLGRRATWDMSKLVDRLYKVSPEIIKKAAMDSYEYQKTLWAAFEKVEREKSITMGVKFNTPDKKAFAAKVKPMMDEEGKNAVIGKLLGDIAAVK